MSQNQLLEDCNSEDEEIRVSLNKKELKDFVIRTVHQVIEQNISPLISTIVKQELELAGEKIWTSLNNHSGMGIQSSESRSLQLAFMDKLFLPVMTSLPIRGVGPTPFRVALIDATTKQVVTSGLEASAKVEIVVVEGDFDGDNWTLEEFNDKIVRGKEGKKSLLTGNVHLNLEEGVGLVRDISFTHNSHWMKVCKLCLGAKVVDNLNGTRVREAVTEPFVLRDFRNSYTKKNFPPSLNDEVWRLKMIFKDGPFHRSLVNENIKTVKDFLIRFFRDPQSLQNILGTAKRWEAIVDHARSCVLDKSLQLYFPIGSEKKSGVVFNVVGQVMGLISECCYVPLDKLSEDQKADANKLVVSALEHMEEVKSINDDTCMHSYLQLLNDAYPSNSPRLGSPSHCYCEPSYTHHRHDHTQPSTSSHNNQVVPFHLPDDANPSNNPSTDSLGFMSIDPSFGSASDEHDWQYIEDPIDEGSLFSPRNLFNSPFFYPVSESQSENQHLKSTDMYHSSQYLYASSEAQDSVVPRDDENQHLVSIDTDHSSQYQYSSSEAQDGFVPDISRARGKLQGRKPFSSCLKDGGPAAR